MTAEDAAHKLPADVRGTTTLLDALVALRFPGKQDDRFFVPDSLAAILTSDQPTSVLAMARHQAHCLRRWAQLAKVVQTGRPAERMPSVRGAEADTAAFIGAMHVINTSTADSLVRAIQPLQFRHLLDVGGASGTWTIAFLGAHPSATATL